MEPVADAEGDGSAGGNSRAVLGVLPGGRPGGLSVDGASFPPRVAAFLRYSPVIEAAQTARRRGWADGAYDIVTLALTAIDLVVSRQGFEEEATRGDVVSALTGLAALAAPDRTAEEHADVARFVIDFLLNRQAHHAKFRGPGPSRAADRGQRGPPGGPGRPPAGAPRDRVLPVPARRPPPLAAAR